MQRLCLKKAFFCNSPLRNDSIPIQDMPTHKPLRSALLMQRFVSHIAFRKTAQKWFCSGTKRYIVTYRCIPKCHKALQNARVKQRIQGCNEHTRKHDKHETLTTKMIHKKHGLGTVSKKYIFTGELKLVSLYQPRS